MKQCSKCNEWKEEGEFGIGRNQCKKCRNNDIKETKLKYREKYLNMQKMYRKNNPNLNKLWHLNNPESRKESNKKRYLKNKSLIDKQNKKWLLENPEKRKDIANRYAVKKSLGKQGISDAPTDLIECKLLIIKTKRLCKTLSN